MTAALQGRRNADKYEAERQLRMAWHIGAFSGAAFGGKLKSFQHYRRQMDSDGKSPAAQAIGFFHALKAKGVPIKIERVPRN